MPGLVPGIHVLTAMKEDVDGRDEPGHDEDGEDECRLLDLSR
jgi:hypothetical protein